MIEESKLMRKMDPAVDKTIKNTKFICHNCLIKATCITSRTLQCKKEVEWALGMNGYPMFLYLKELNTKELLTINYKVRTVKDIIDNVIVNQTDVLYDISVHALLDDNRTVNVMYNHFTLLMHKQNSMKIFLSVMRQYLYDNAVFTP